MATQAETLKAQLIQECAQEYVDYPHYGGPHIIAYTPVPVCVLQFIGLTAKEFDWLVRKEIKKIG
jgi:hypothetical protein